MIQIGSKKASYYKGLLEHADPKLHEQLAYNVDKLIKKGGRLLDLGAGQGAMSERLLDLGYKVVAADSDPDNFMCDDATFHKIDFNKAQEIKLLEKEKFRQIKIMPGGTLPTIWVTRILLFIIANILSFLIRPFMKGVSQGWCIIVIAKK
jgi:ribosomal protein L11 methylase PrmA